MKPSYFIKILFVVSMLLFQACDTRELKPDEQLAYEINFKVSESLEKKYNIHFMGVKLGGPEKINLMGLMFQIKHPLSKEECRGLIVSCAKEYLTAIEEKEEFQKYLFQSPFPLQNIEIDIYIHAKDNICMRYPNISIVCINCGKIYYKSFDDEKPYGFKTTESEPYEEALRIVKAKSFQLPIQHQDIQ